MLLLDEDVGAAIKVANWIRQPYTLAVGVEVGLANMASITGFPDRTITDHASITSFPDSTGSSITDHAP